MKKIKIKHYVHLALMLLKYLSIWPVAYLMYLNDKNKNIWLVSERGVDARDNAYHLITYIWDQHPEITAYFVISRKSPDREKLKNKGNIIEYKSLKHYLYFWISDVKISTHVMGYSPDTTLFNKLDRFGLVRGKKIFLQHGITKDYIPGITYPNIDLDLFVCGAEPEFECVKSKYNFPPDVVKYLGLARFDALYDIKIKKQIIIMPTWRTWLSSLNGVAEFKQTDYFRRYNALINDSRLMEILEKNKYELVFYPHYEIQKFLHAFEANSPRIHLADLENYDVQPLLKESELLITDYSSVYFDFAYMDKAVLYYHFDYDKFCESHYSKGYFDYEKDGFGPVLSEKKELIEAIESHIKRNEFDNELYKSRRDLFFPLHDKDNCRRNFEAIMNTLEK